MLFVPGDRPDRIAKALASPADAVIVDLEDAVALSRKNEARSNLASALGAPRTKAATTKAAYVRVNPMTTSHALDDLLAVVRAGADGIVLPKVESMADVVASEWTLDQAGAPEGFDLILILETAKGITGLPHILKSARRARRANIGAGDLSRDLGLSIGPDETELAAYRAGLVAACRANGFHAPLDTVWGDLSDEGGLRRSAERAQRAGFAGKLAIHPRQVEVINDVFAPSPEEIARAQRIVSAFDEAEAAGNASIEVDGAFVDYPVAEQARRTLALAERVARTDRA